MILRRMMASLGIFYPLATEQEHVITLQHLAAVLGASRTPVMITILVGSLQPVHMFIAAASSQRSQIPAME